MESTQLAIIKESRLAKDIHDSAISLKILSCGKKGMLSRGDKVIEVKVVKMVAGDGEFNLSLSLSLEILFLDRSAL